MTSTYSLANMPRLMGEDGARNANRYENLALAVSRREERIIQEHSKRLQQLWADAADAYGRIAASAKDQRLADDAKTYMTDAAQPGALMPDILRERADQDAAHEAAGTPPVLIYDYDVILDGKTLSRPSNKVLLRIRPPEGVEVDEQKRPFMIVEPRAGLGTGIGGFKPDSQVGVALHIGHPVYFVVFRQHPEPGQTLADVMHAEAEFVAEISRRHPEAEKPVVVGNCQGGWATMIMAACNPEITGPIVINGAPISTWSGRLGENAMRYNGGMLGGGLPALLLSDLGDGVYDGAYMVSGFELANPGPKLFRQVLRCLRRAGEGAREVSRVRKVVGCLPVPQREGDALDRRAVVHRQQARARRGSPRARRRHRSEEDPFADHRLRVVRRQYHAATAGAQLDPRHLRRRRGNQDPRPAHHLHGA